MRHLDRSWTFDNRMYFFIDYTVAQWLIIMVRETITPTMTAYHNETYIEKYTF